MRIDPDQSNSNSYLSLVKERRNPILLLFTAVLAMILSLYLLNRDVENGVRLYEALVSSLLSLALVVLYSQMSLFSKRQTEIMENQQRIIELDFRPYLSISHINPSGANEDTDKFQVSLENVGNGIADRIHLCITPTFTYDGEEVFRQPLVGPYITPLESVNNPHSTAITGAKLPDDCSDRFEGNLYLTGEDDEVRSILDVLEEVKNYESTAPTHLYLQFSAIYRDDVGNKHLQNLSSIKIQIEMVSNYQDIFYDSKGELMVPEDILMRQLKEEEILPTLY